MIRVAFSLGVLLGSAFVFRDFLADAVMWWSAEDRRWGLTLGLLSSAAQAVVAAEVDLTWHAPNQTAINNLTSVLGGSGVYGFIYNTSQTPDALYGTYNWCNMPHVRPDEYPWPPAQYELQYVELVRQTPPAPPNTLLPSSPPTDVGGWGRRC